MKFYFRYLLFIVLGIILLTGLGNAQTVSPWFRLRAGVPFEVLKKQAFTLPQLTHAPLSVPKRGLVSTKTVKTTVPNWLAYKLFHSGTLSSMEKNILQQNTDHLIALSGKLQFFYDRDLLLAAALPASGPTQWDESAFHIHQNLLQSTRMEIELFAQEEIAQALAENSLTFTQNEILAILKSNQLPAFILTRKEIENFPQLSLQEQRHYASQMIDYSYQGMLALLQKEPTTLSAEDFANFYRYKCRWYYFSQLLRVLEHTAQPRPTIVIRLRQTLNFDFLPNPSERLTDAQRLGKLHFYQDIYTQDTPHEHYAKQLDAEIINQRINANYAQAEALHFPYEMLLRGKVLHPEMILSEDLLASLKHHSEQENLVLLTQLLERQEYKMALFRREHPSPSLLDFADYYRLVLEKQQLQGLRTRAHLFSTLWP